MTEKARAKLTRQIIKTVDRNNHNWKFNGQRFETWIPIWYEHVGYQIRIQSTIDEVKTEFFVRKVCGETIDPEAYFREVEFSGKTSYADAVQWIAERVAEVAERFEDQSAVYRLQSAYRADVEQTLRRILS